MSGEAAPVDGLRRIGIIGAGQMGGGIAHVCALAGLEVAITDVDDEALQRGREAIDRNLSRHSVTYFRPKFSSSPGRYFSRTFWYSRNASERTRLRTKSIDSKLRIGSNIIIAPLTVTCFWNAEL